VTVVGIAARPVFDHLDRLTDERGLYEHALFDQPRPEHGYCVDDAARALIVACREPRPDARLRALSRTYLDFTLAALDSAGRCRNRMTAAGLWSDAPELGDWWGRAVWGLGVAAAHAPSEAMRARALFGFRLAARQRSPHLRASTFAGLGAAELLLVKPAETAAIALLSDTVAMIATSDVSLDWQWPEPRLTYANASVAELMLVAGSVLGGPELGGPVLGGPELGGPELGGPELIEIGLRWLGFLLRTETRDGQLSVTPVTGRGPESGVLLDSIAPAFDQQPIEVAAIADACARAYAITGDEQWLWGVQMAWSWFLGANDSSTVMFDARTGGGFDGLQRIGCNLNQGAESTLAMLSTAQHARTLAVHG
jgi:hypothetical protein